MEDRYEIRGKIGQGGLGGVYRAYDLRMNREVAIKRITRSAADAELEHESTRQLMKEAGALAALQHPHIVTVYDFGTDEDGPYVVMELISGKTLDELIEVAPLTWQDFRELALQTQEALIAAQELDLIHSDLKPSNLMLTWLPSGKFQVKIVDFGLATLARSQSKEDLASLEAVFGSVFFMAPEQFEREPVDARSDLYSMGCVYYQALTGNYPFSGKTGEEVMTAHLNHKVIPIQNVRDDLPSWVCDWVMWHLNRRPEDRPESAREALSIFLQNDQNPSPTVSLGSAQPANTPKRPRLIIPGAQPPPAPAPPQTPMTIPVAAPSQPEEPIVEAVPVAAPFQPEEPVADAVPVAAPSQDEEPVAEALPVAAPFQPEEPVAEAVPVAAPSQDEEPIAEALPVAATPTAAPVLQAAPAKPAPASRLLTPSPEKSSAPRPAAVAPAAPALAIPTPAQTAKPTPPVAQPSPTIAAKAAPVLVKAASPLSSPATPTSQSTPQAKTKTSPQPLSPPPGSKPSIHQQIPPTASFGTAAVTASQPAQQATTQPIQPAQQPPKPKRQLSNASKMMLATVLGILVILLTWLLLDRRSQNQQVALYNQMIQLAAKDDTTEIPVNQHQLNILLNAATDVGENQQRYIVYKALFLAKSKDGTDVDAKILETAMRPEIVPEIRVVLIRDVIRKRKQPKVVPTLVAYASNPATKADDATAALEAVRFMAGDDQADPFLEIIKSTSHEKVRKAAEETLEELIQKSSSKSTLTSKLSAIHRNSKEETIRHTMIRLLGRCGGQDALALVTEVLKGTDAKDRPAAITSLGNWADDEGFKALADFLDHNQDLSLRARAFEAMSRFAANPPKQGSLSNEDRWKTVTSKSRTREEKLQTIRGLAQYQDDWSLKLLEPYKSDEDDKVVDLANKAIDRIQQQRKAAGKE